ncbi:MAG: BCCT family transporter, partial [Woeseiaceae bacterium]|nr:BCCT family transporter [Woeseiaceae bacterium]
VAYEIITDRFGIAYLLYGAGTLTFLVWLALSRYGTIVLGESRDRTEFRTLTWVAMLFCAGVGAGLLYWAVIEWAYYLRTPPFGLEPGSTAAIEWAASYGLFHWGLTGWALFCLPAIAIAYPYYVRKVPYLRLSTACLPYLPGGTNSRRGRFIDFLFMINLIGGTGTSLGLSTPMIAASFSALTGLPHDFLLEISMVMLCIGLFGASAWLGLQDGIRRLSNWNLWLAFALLAFVLAAGPTTFILKTGLNSIGLVLQNFIRLNTWTDPFTDSRFVENWTVFYWAWWVAYGPFVGIFVTRISRGRTIRQVVSGMLVFGSLGAAAFFIVFGNYALDLQLSGLLSVTALIDESGEATAIAAVFETLPLGKLALAGFFAVAVIFVATTYDSASYTLASVSTERLQAGENPARWTRLFWACALGILPVTLMFVDGGLRVILSATIVVSLPLLLLGVLMAASLLRMLREDHPAKL